MTTDLTMARGTAAPDGEGDGMPPASRVPTSTGEYSLRERAALLSLLVGTAVLYMWNLGASGYGNDFYAAAVQAGTKSWKAFFFGSFDSSNAITVDKPPASLWPMELSGRLFGFNSWSMLLPQAVEGVLAVWLLYAMVRRWFGGAAGLLAGSLLALTPVAVLMFRFNNPDALMTLLIVVAAYCVTRALEAASTRWLLFAGLAIGFSFLAKGLQPFTVLPALALAYLVAAPTSLRRRLLQLLGAGSAVVAGAGWWVLAVDLTPAADRPYIGGSGNNTALGLAFGYNGLSRITGTSSGGAGGGGGANFSGSAGIGRLFNALNGGQIAWLLPTSMVAIVALAVLSHRAPRTDRTRAALILWGGWLLVTGAVLSYASGIIHTYYAVELAPAIAALVGIGAVLLWRQRGGLPARLLLAIGAMATGIWSYTLLHRSPGWHPWIAGVVLGAAVLCAIALALPGRVRHAGIAAAICGVVALGGGSTAYALSTASTPHTGAIPSAGPTVRSADLGRLGGLGGPGGAIPGASGRRPFGRPPGGGSGAPPGDLPGATATSSALTSALKSTTTRWAAAAIGSQSAAPLELASGKAVMSIGGFNGGDNAPTLAQFEKYVAAGDITYFIAGGQGGGPGGPGGQVSGSAISSWVAAHYTSTTIGGVTVYDLTQPSN
jgi:4-amino-4-deoxy-L-arabinose transferase-like glycosyltransferase